MASITKKIRDGGSFTYKASIVIKKDGVIIHRESKTLAVDWGERREVELSDLKKLLNVDTFKLNVHTLTAKDLIKRRNFKHIDY